jgi:hypothetical protein
MKIRPVGPKMFHADRRTDGRTDRHKEANNRFRSFANAPKSCYPNLYRIHISRPSKPQIRELSCLSYPENAVISMSNTVTLLQQTSLQYLDTPTNLSRPNLEILGFGYYWSTSKSKSVGYQRAIQGHRFLNQCKTTSKAKFQVFRVLMLCHCVCLCAFTGVSRDSYAFIFKEKQFKTNYIPEYTHH